MQYFLKLTRYFLCDTGSQQVSENLITAVEDGQLFHQAVYQYFAAQPREQSSLVAPNYPVASYVYCQQY